MAGDRDKPRFEPPPWEQEAFERFQKEQQEAKAKEDLRATLQAVRERAAAQAAAQAAVESDAGTGAIATSVPIGSEVAPKPKDSPAVLPEARIEAMLIQLKAEEQSGTKRNMWLIDGVMAFMTLSGVVLIIEAARLFANTRGSQAGTLLAGTVSLMILLTGSGFLGGAILLFRKYHQ